MAKDMRGMSCVGEAEKPERGERAAVSMRAVIFDACRRISPRVIAEGLDQATHGLRRYREATNGCKQFCIEISAVAD